jgi:serine/threonine-protein kinase
VEDEGLRAGQVLLGRYRVGERLGAGGMGAVYEAFDEREAAVVALKVIHPRQSLEPEYRERLRLEGRAMVELEHPHIVRVFAVVEAEGCSCLVMERVHGRTLHERLHDGPLAAEEALRVNAQILEALSAAHARGIVHRDLKPRNVFLAESPDGPWVKLFDFGVVKFLSEGATRHLTRTGMVVGTPEYMAPEQAIGEPIDGRADLYAAGCVLYETITGRPPFIAATALEVMNAHVSDAVPRLSAARADAAHTDLLDPIVRRALAKAPAARFQSAAEMLVTVEAALAALPDRATAGQPQPASGTQTLPPRAERVPLPEVVSLKDELLPTPRASWAGMILAGMLGALVAAAIGYFVFVR